MQLGIVGLPMVGKSTVFQLLTGSENAGFSVGKSQSAMARIPDRRIDHLSSVYRPKKTSYAQLEVVDIPGLVPGTEKGSNVFLDSIRRADALLHVVRAFDDQSVASMHSGIDPLRDLEVIAYELLISDMDLIEKRIERINNNKKKSQMQDELDLLLRLQGVLDEEKALSSAELNGEEERMMSGYQFLTLKPLILCVNINEDEITAPAYPQRDALLQFCRERQMPLIEMSAEIERQLLAFDGEERTEFMNDLGLAESGVDKIARGIYERLGLISFFTVGEDEVKAWTIEKGCHAKAAAGKIHSDIERGFIRAEVFAYDDYVRYGTTSALREQGLLRLEGKEYEVKDGDIVHFRFNV
ncbi:MAG: redox-regulated ATPase YchF [Syntrophomonadaceae bacterium]|nr:redox-regulated ATPase YchF [Syntrophomonadaceae bacterium]